MSSKELIQLLSSTNCFQGKKLSLTEILQSKDQRQQIQQECLQKYSCSLISVSLVAPGNIKKNPLLDYIFERALEEIRLMLQQHKLNFQEKIQKQNLIHFAIFIVDEDALKLKKLTTDLEESTPLARIWDLDIFTKNGDLISREEINLAPRKCLVCEQNAKVCARSRIHNIQKILTKIQQLALKDIYIKNISELAYQALIKEVTLTPKPGLVDLDNNGAHQDMDVSLFLKSALVIKPFFKKFVQKGIEIRKKEDILSQIRPIGIEAEKQMFMATQKVNTHKGSIFSMGLACTAAGYFYPNTLNAKKISLFISEICQDILKDFSLNKSTQKSYGFTVYEKYHLTGARGEAHSGFKTIIDFSLPVYKKYKKHEEEKALLLSLLHLLSVNNDTNIINRGGIESLIWLKKEAQSLIETPLIYKNKSILIANLKKLDEQCITRNLSPGGSADLISLTWFLNELEESYSHN